MGKEIWAVLNKVTSDQMKPNLANTLKQSGIEVAGTIPDDPVIFSAGFEGRTIGPCAASGIAEEIIDLCLKN